MDRFDDRASSDDSDGDGEPDEASGSDHNPYSGSSPAERTDAVVQLSGLKAAIDAEMARVIVAADDARDWEADGATDVAAWLAGHCAMSQISARRTARVARALVGLPHLHEALAGGALSWEQICPATRFATRETDAHLARILPGHSVEQIEELARQHRARRDDEANDAHRRRRFGWRQDHDAGGFRYNGFLPADQGVAVNAVLTTLAEAAGPVPETGLWEPFPTRCADALHSLADDAAVDDTETAPARGAPSGSSATSDGGSSDSRIPACPPERMLEMLGRGVGCHVSIHVDDDVLAGTAPGNGGLDGMSVGVSTVRRLLCDAQRSTTVEDAHGRAVGIGRNAHDPPRWLRRQVVHRDGCCRFPGCQRQIRHLHHIAWWTRDDGPTDAPNLAGLCWAHHRLVHEGGWTIEGNADGRLEFISPVGRILTSARQPTRRSTLAAADEAFGLRVAEEGRTRDDREDEDGAPGRVG